jgi:hypothetical protein
MLLRRELALIPLLVFSAAAPSRAETPFRIQEIETGLGVGYAVRLVDVNGDHKRDIVVVDTERVLWFENPTWQRHAVIQGQTKPDNVCIAPYDIDGDGKLDFALGADWRPFDTKSGGTIQWLRQGSSAAEPFTLHPIGEEPTVHRMNWGDFDGDGRSELIVVPLMGKNTTRPAFSEHPIRILSYKIPADPVKGPWQPEVINESLYVAHNFTPTDLDHDGQLDLLVASFEGVTLLKRSADGKWTSTHIGEGNQNNTRTPPNRGASEIKHGQLRGQQDYIATIEPWHGFQVVVYTRPESRDPQALWNRSVLDDQLQWGHAVACVNLDDDADQELVIGVRDDYKTEGATHPCGVRIYDPQVAASGKVSWSPAQRLDAGGVAVEDLAAEDLDGDGRIDLVAVGRKTKNVRIYWNQN